MVDAKDRMTCTSLTVQREETAKRLTLYFKNRIPEDFRHITPHSFPLSSTPTDRKRQRKSDCEANELSKLHDLRKTFSVAQRNF